MNALVVVKSTFSQFFYLHLNTYSIKHKSRDLFHVVFAREIKFPCKYAAAVSIFRIKSGVSPAIKRWQLHTRKEFKERNNQYATEQVKEFLYFLYTPFPCMLIIKN